MIVVTAMRAEEEPLGRAHEWALGELVEGLRLQIARNSYREPALRIVPSCVGKANSGSFLQNWRGKRGNSWRGRRKQRRCSNGSTEKKRGRFQDRANHFRQLNLKWGVKKGGLYKGWLCMSR